MRFPVRALLLSAATLATVGCGAPEPHLQVEVDVTRDACSDQGCYLEAVPEATVEVLLGDEPVESSRTDDEGIVSFASLPAGEYHVVARWENQRSAPTEVLVNDGPGMTSISIRFPARWSTG